MRNKRVKLRGNYNPTGTTRKKPNLQKTFYKGESILSCTKCIKRQKKAK